MVTPEGGDGRHIVCFYGCLGLLDCPTIDLVFGHSFAFSSFRTMPEACPGVLFLGISTHGFRKGKAPPDFGPAFGIVPKGYSMNLSECLDGPGTPGQTLFEDPCIQYWYKFP